MVAKKIENKESVEKLEVISSMLVKPRITEKASLQSEVNAYTFIVKSNATKLTIKDEIKKNHNIVPLHINITNLPAKKVFVRGKWGVKSAMKKAVIFLKKGDTLKLN
jgi:large subunit ribosomal protein L23